MYNTIKFTAYDKIKGPFCHQKWAEKKCSLYNFEYVNKTKDTPKLDLF